jgi:predicted acyltransferase
MVKTASNRILALDILRGITIAGMILVNNPGDWSYTFAPLKHAEWLGVTPTDMVFPFFMFIMGFSTYLSLKKFNFELSWKAALKIIRRTIVIFAIGLLITWLGLFCDTWKGLIASQLPFIDHFSQSLFDLSHLRILGVLQRLALSYGIAAFIVLLMKHKYIPWLVVSLFIIYFIILITGNGFVNSHDSILYRFDVAVMGADHLWAGDIVDPEGFLGTICSVGHVLIGFYVASIVMKEVDLHAKVERLFICGFILLAGAMLLSFGCPISKKIWTPTFAMFTCGLASSALALLIWIIDIKGCQRWSNPFHVFGVNPLFLYTLSEVLAILFGFFHVPHSNPMNIHDMLCMGALEPLLGKYLGALMYSLLFVAINWCAGYILFKKKIYIKI